MASFTRMSVLIAESDTARRRGAAELLRELGVQHITEVSDAYRLEAALRERAFDVLLCAERLGDEAGLALLQTARKAAPATRSVLLRSGQLPADVIAGGVDAIASPLSKSSLQSLLQQTASPHGGLWCEVPALSLSDILQMYHQARRSITVLLSGPVAGRVRLDSGEIVDAEMGDERGMAALSRLLEAETGLIRTAPAAPGAECTIDGPFESVLLEAAQKLDERRRDSLLLSEAPSVPMNLPIPSVPPRPLAQAPDPASFLAPYAPLAPRRPRTALIGVLLGGALAAGAGLYVARGAAPRDLGTRQPEALAAPELEQSARALRPVASPERLPAPEPDEAPGAAAIDTPAPEPPASFTLHLTSKPNHATVLEGGKVLGKTPLDLSIGTRSGASGARRFTLRHSGYLPSRIVQPASSSHVDVLVVLTPRSASLADRPDAGRADSEAAAPGRDTHTRSRRREPNIRTRR